MTITNKQLLEIEGALAYVSKEQTEAWYQVGRNIQRIKPFLERFGETRKEIIERLAEKDKDGNPKVEGNNISFGENAEEFIEKFTELMEESIEVDFYVFPFDKFGSAKLDAIKVQPLMDIIVEE